MHTFNAWVQLKIPQKYVYNLNNNNRLGLLVKWLYVKFKSYTTFRSLPVDPHDPSMISTFAHTVNRTSQKSLSVTESYGICHPIFMEYLPLHLTIVHFLILIITSSQSKAPYHSVIIIQIALASGTAHVFRFACRYVRSRGVRFVTESTNNCSALPVCFLARTCLIDRNLGRNTCAMRKWRNDYIKTDRFKITWG